MKVVANTTLKHDPKKPMVPAGEVVDLPKKLADELLERGMVRLPVVEAESSDDDSTVANAVD
jgi:hypothetical protein